jgi:hypothetical protein
MASQRPAFTLLGGDICYADPSGTGLPADDSLALTNGAPVGKNSYNPYVWDVFLNQIESQAAYTPWMFATGNHDMEPLYGNTEFLGDSPSHGYGGHAARLDLPRSGPKGCPSVYKFVYGNVGVISVDANDLLSSSTIARTPPLQTMRPTVVSVRRWTLFSQFQVDLVVQGHNHILERTDPIKNGHKTISAPDGSTITPATDGVTYICVGSGGRPRYAFRPAPCAAAPA